VKNLFVGNLGSEVTHEELRRLFEAYGQVVQVHIIVDRDTGLPRGFAFVEMTNDADAEKAINRRIYHQCSGWTWASLSSASSPHTVGLVSGFCSSARVFDPRFFQTPPRDDALALL
jgi:RNA recognition motif. (a.k.a. RRM, RBD, or RNP domain)